MNKRFFKKAISLFLALMMLAGLTASVNAATINETANEAADTKIYFEVPESWGTPKSIYCHIWHMSSVEGGSEGEFFGWKAKRELCTKIEDGLYFYDTSILEETVYGKEKGLNPSKKYGVIFAADTVGLQTYDLVLTTQCLGDTVYAEEERIRNPIDSNQMCNIARWKENGDVCHPVIQYDSLGELFDPDNTGGPVDQWNYYSIIDNPDLYTPYIDNIYFDNGYLMKKDFEPEEYTYDNLTEDMSDYLLFLVSEENLSGDYLGFFQSFDELIEIVAEEFDWNEEITEYLSNVGVILPKEFTLEEKAMAVEIYELLYWNEFAEYYPSIVRGFNLQEALIQVYIALADDYANYNDADDLGDYDTFIRDIKKAKTYEQSLYALLTYIYYPEMGMKKITTFDDFCEFQLVMAVLEYEWWYEVDLPDDITYEELNKLIAQQDLVYTFGEVPADNATIDDLLYLYLKNEYVNWFGYWDDDLEEWIDGEVPDGATAEEIFELLKEDGYWDYDEYGFDSYYNDYYLDLPANYNGDTVNISIESWRVSEVTVNGKNVAFEYDLDWDSYYSYATVELKDLKDGDIVTIASYGTNGDNAVVYTFEVRNTEAEYELGDVNFDNKVNVKDVSAILKHLVEIELFTEEQREVADFNMDNRLNIKDVSDILKMIVGLYW